MKIKGYLGRSDGQISGPLMGLVVGVVILFIGIFMISAVEEVIPNTDENILTATSNTTPILTGMPGNDTYSLTIGAIILNPTLSILEVAIQNNTVGEEGALNVNVSLNRIAVQNIAIPASSSVTNITSITLLNGTANTVSFGNESWTANSTVILNATIYYVAATRRTTIGTIVDSTVTTTGTIFSVLGLVIIVVALGMAVQSLRKGTL